MELHGIAILRNLVCLSFSWWLIAHYYTPHEKELFVDRVYYKFADQKHGPFYFHRAEKHNAVYTDRSLLLGRICVPSLCTCFLVNVLRHKQWPEYSFIVFFILVIKQTQTVWIESNVERSVIRFDSGGK